MKRLATDLISVSPSLLVLALLTTFFISGSIQLVYYHQIFSSFVEILWITWVLGFLATTGIQLTRLATSTLGAKFSTDGNDIQAKRTWIAGGVVTLIEIAEVFLMAKKMGSPDAAIPFALFGIFFVILSYMLEIQFTLSMYQEEQAEMEKELNKEWDTLSPAEKETYLSKVREHLVQQGVSGSVTNISKHLGIAISTVSKYKTW
jgi:hypothetical protein